MPLGTHVVKNDKFIGPTTIVRADSVENAISCNLRDQLLEEEYQESARNDGQDEVVDLEDEVELESWTVPHQFATTEDDDVVRYQHGSACIVSRQSGLAWDKSKVLWLVALDGFETLFEDWP